MSLARIWFPTTNKSGTWQMEGSVCRRYIQAMTNFRRLAVVVGVVWGISGHVMAADIAGPAVVQAPLVQIEPGDQIRVEVFGNPDLSTVTDVADDGSIRLPLVGAVPVSGQSQTGAAKRIESALKVAELLVDPHVTLTVVKQFHQHVTVAGEVGKPGRYEIEPKSTVMDVIALAGGINEKGSDTIYVLRSDASGVQQKIQVRIDLDLIAGAQGVTGPMQAVQGGDSIVVPKATFTIIGQVTTPGEYRIPSGMILFQAIARAGGVTALGSTSRIEIRRRGPDGKFVELKGKKDMPVEPGDVITVKERLF
jgi:polysaccharide biosynthesis/export protein